MTREVRRAEGTRRAAGRGNADAHSRYQFPTPRDCRNARKAFRKAGRRICRAYLAETRDGG